MEREGKEFGKGGKKTKGFVKGENMGNTTLMKGSAGGRVSKGNVNWGGEKSQQQISPDREGGGRKSKTMISIIVKLQGDRVNEEKKWKESMKWGGGHLMLRWTGGPQHKKYDQGGGGKMISSTWLGG